ncbi:uncharacterized protein A4U43_C06F14380 [Asparagus officinalis]|uniref:Bifunctional inhibitor/plant lipid transfer protein/seed storage helical domain-containing protein n=1 Tax=Asparagus officinalis TaxID=4686 RepID=A0A5P1EM46_ASPOF|nr:uncharacterized protein LOC109824036 [Asparagus officinalis]XP_020251168.1 uncharacterized protein LOC109828623 [Asparagus officinalis]XP_020269566.1 uncharacterized protein LOC109844828 [Asparagus officinalis]ONK66996.1 uncharacterized protein A4U43_C06F14380 [Asparagus officinalis]
MAQLIKTCFLLLAFTIITASLFADNASADCDNDWTQLSDKCTAFAKKGIEPTLPSDDCCQTIAQADLVCACSKVTPDTENNISVPLAIMVASFCGHSLPHGTHCGSVVVP